MTPEIGVVRVDVTLAGRLAVFTRAQSRSGRNAGSPNPVSCPSSFTFPLSRSRAATTQRQWPVLPPLPIHVIFALAQKRPGRSRHPIGLRHCDQHDRLAR
jgi:hypothetical protein